VSPISIRNLIKEKEMKTLISSYWHRMVTVLLSVLSIGVGLLFSGVASAQMTGTAHDFSANNWNGYTEICVVCHTPHNAYTEGEAGAGPGELGPLWNRALTNVNNFSTYLDQARVGSDIQGTGFSNNLTGVSKLCLSCHDGTIAIDSFGRDASGLPINGTTFVGTINANANIGEGDAVAQTGNLSNDHPVAFTFPTTDTEIVTISGNTVNGQTTDMPLFGAGQMECATCHDVHARGTFGPLLRVDNTNSGLCLNCHIK
jgi:predicted CXXCH cytochrome family protein